MPARWELAAEARGGSVTGLAATHNMLFAATPVGVYRSTNGASGWELPGSAPTVPLASAVVPSPAFERDRTLFACGADALYRSSDAGATWHHVLLGQGMLSVTVAFGTSDELVVLAGTEVDGILRSDDAGRSWSGANAGLVDLTAIALATSPCFASDRTAFAGTASGLYRTRNGARSWRSIETGLEDPAVQSVLVSPQFAEDRLVLAGTEAHGLLRSVDGGNTWHQPASLASGGVTALAAVGGVIAAATERGIAFSEDGGETWRLRDDGPRESALSLVFDPQGLLVGLHKAGLVRSCDKGTTWEPTNEGLSARLDTQLLVSSSMALFIGGLEEGLRYSTDAGRTWAHAELGPAETAVHSLAASADRLWAATAAGLFASDDSGKSWQRYFSDAVPARVVAAASGSVVAALDGGVLQLSRDSGASWRALHTPADGADVVALAVQHDRTVLAATATTGEATLWRWHDQHGWSRLLVESSAGALRLALAIVPGVGPEPGVLVGIGRRVLRPLRDAQEVRHRERRPMWRATDLGGQVVNVTSLAIAADGRTVVAATNAGVFLSRDAGETFTDWGDGLPNPRVVAVTIAPASGDVYALALGGSLWRRTI